MSAPPKRLLVLDDDVAVARTIGMIAEGQGFAVQCFQDAVAFLDAVRAQAPSHVALDLIMPGMDGIEVLRMLAKERCEAAVILTSGMDGKVLEAAQATAAERGLLITGVLPKPFRRQSLRDLLERDVQPRRSPGTGAAGASPVSPDMLAAAIGQRRLSVVAQPKLDLATRRVVGAEILARWQDPRLGAIPPDVFIAVGEAAGLMPALTRLVLEQALGWFAQSPLRVDGSVAVNLSTASLGDVGLADEIEAACRAAGVDTERLILEITESSAMDRTADTFDTLTRLRLKGFRLSIDDFGTGHSSLSQLSRLPLSELKIDKSFVLGLHASPDARKIVEATIRLAEDMALTSVAEGVEDAEALEALAALGCTMAQGFHISPPLPVDRFDAWLGEVVAMGGIEPPTSGL